MRPHPSQIFNCMRLSFISVFSKAKNTASLPRPVSVASGEASCEDCLVSQALWPALDTTCTSSPSLLWVLHLLWSWENVESRSLTFARAKGIFLASHAALACVGLSAPLQSPVCSAGESSLSCGTSLCYQKLSISNQSRFFCQEKYSADSIFCDSLPILWLPSILALALC